MRDEAAVRVQTTVRGRLAKADVLMRRRNIAATRVQSRVRGHQARQVGGKTNVVGFTAATPREAEEMNAGLGLNSLTSSAVYEQSPQPSLPVGRALWTPGSRSGVGSSHGRLGSPYSQQVQVPANQASPLLFDSDASRDKFLRQRAELQYWVQKRQSTLSRLLAVRKHNGKLRPRSTNTDDLVERVTSRSRAERQRAIHGPDYVLPPLKSPVPVLPRRVAAAGGRVAPHSSSPRTSQPRHANNLTPLGIANASSSTYRRGATSR